MNYNTLCLGRQANLVSCLGLGWPRSPETFLCAPIGQGDIFGTKHEEIRISPLTLWILKNGHMKKRHGCLPCFIVEGTPNLSLYRTVFPAFNYLQINWQITTCFYENSKTTCNNEVCTFFQDFLYFIGCSNSPFLCLKMCWHLMFPSK